MICSVGAAMSCCIYISRRYIYIYTLTLFLFPDPPSGKTTGADEGRTDGEDWKMISAVTYRLTRKHILEATVLKLELIECYLRGFLAKSRAQAAMRELQASVVGRDTVVGTSISSSLGVSTSLLPVSREPLTAIQTSDASHTAQADAALSLPETPPRVKNNANLSQSRLVRTCHLLGICMQC